MHLFRRATAMAFSWMMATSAMAVTVADSVADFGAVQGGHGWYYGYYGGALDSASFSLLSTYDTVQRHWVETSNPAAFWTSLSASSAHPNGSPTSNGRTPVVQWAVRRWIVPTDGVYSLDGQLAKLDGGGLGGNGVAGHIIVDGVERYLQAIPGTDTAGVSYHLTLSLLSGSTVDFALDPVAGDDRYDSTRFTAVIGTVPELPPATLLAAGLMLVAVRGRPARAR